MTTASPTTADRTRLQRRAGLLAVAAGFAATDLAIKAWAVDALADAPIEAGPLDLRLAFNPGAAFSIAADAPAWVLLTMTGLITLAVADAGWRTAPRAGLTWRLGLAAILGGASANLLDRLPDGVVTDYLHTGWWPTFNLADSFIVVGATALVTLTVFGSPAAPFSREAAYSGARPGHHSEQSAFSPGHEATAQNKVSRTRNDR